MPRDLLTDQPILTLLIQDRSRKFIPTIRKIESWRYYEIIDELRSLGVERQAAYDAAKWASRCRESGVQYTGLSDYILRIE